MPVSLSEWRIRIGGFFQRRPCVTVHDVIKPIIARHRRLDKLQRASSQSGTPEESDTVEESPLEGEQMEEIQEKIPESSGIKIGQHDQSGAEYTGAEKGKSRKSKKRNTKKVLNFTYIHHIFSFIFFRMIFTQFTFNQ